jgi:hypothetical protein
MIGNISGEQVPGSPFWLHVVSGEMDANHCSAQGPALQSIFYGSDNAVFNIETFDSYNNPVGVGGHEFDVHVLGSDTTSAAHMDRGNNNAATSKATTTLATGSKKAALRDALNHAARLEGEMELLSSSHEAVLRGEATTGNVSDFGNGTYGVQFNPCDVPQWLQKHHKSLVILVVDAVSGEHIGGSPFIVPCIQSPVHASQCTLELHHVHDVVAGNVYSAMIHLPDHHHHHHHHHTSHNTPLPFALPLFPSITIRPIWSGETNTIPVQSSCVYSISNTLIRSLFSVKSTSLDPLTYEVAFGGGLVCASGGRSNHLPIIDFRAYAIGKNINEGMEFPEDPNELAPIHDFMLEDTQNDLAPEILAMDKVMLIIVYNASKSNEKGFIEIKEIADKAINKGYNVYGVSASFEDDLILIQNKYNLPFDFLFCDETTLKTMIRANPGVMTLSKGTVTGKWNWNDTSDIKL